MRKSKVPSPKSKVKRGKPGSGGDAPVGEARARVRLALSPRTRPARTLSSARQSGADSRFFVSTIWYMRTCIFAQLRNCATTQVPRSPAHERPRMLRNPAPCARHSGLSPLRIPAAHPLTRARGRGQSEGLVRRCTRPPRGIPALQVAPAQLRLLRGVRATWLDGRTRTAPRASSRADSRRAGSGRRSRKCGH
jgi:hypothetical protein